MSIVRENSGKDPSESKMCRYARRPAHFVEREKLIILREYFAACTLRSVSYEMY